MPTDALSAARQRVASIGLADAVFAMLANGEPVRDARLTDGNAPTVWTAVSKRLAGFASGRYRHTADVGLRDLNARLTSLLAEVRAADADRADLSEYVSRYRAIRGAQTTLTYAAVGRSFEVEFPDLALRIPLARLLDFAGTVANIDEVWPSWRDFTRGNGFDAPPWEHPEGRPFDIQATATNLRWLAAPQVKAWVPTLKQAARVTADQMQAEEARRLATAKRTSPYG